MGSGSSKVKKLKPEKFQTQDNSTVVPKNLTLGDKNNNSSTKLNKSEKVEENVPGMVAEKVEQVYSGVTSQALILGRQRLKSTPSNYTLVFNHCNNNSNKTTPDNLAPDYDDIDLLIAQELNAMERNSDDVSSQKFNDVINIDGTKQKPVAKPRKEKKCTPKQATVNDTSLTETSKTNMVSKRQIRLQKPLPAPRFSMRRKITKISSFRHRNLKKNVPEFYGSDYTDLERQLMEDIERDF